MNPKLNMVLIITNVILIIIATNSFIGIELSYKYGTLDVILNDDISETARQQEFDNYMSRQKEKGKRILVYLILLIIALAVLIIIRRKAVEKERYKTLLDEEVMENRLE